MLGVRHGVAHVIRQQFSVLDDRRRPARTFAAIGAVQGVRIIVDRETRRGRGFAFVELLAPEAIDLAIEQLKENEFRGRRLVVSKARGREAGGTTAIVRGTSAGNDAGPPFRHRIVIDRSDEARASTATVPDLGLSVNAATIEAALRQVQTRACGCAFGGEQA